MKAMKVPRRTQKQIIQLAVYSALLEQIEYEKNTQKALEEKIKMEQIEKKRIEEKKRWEEIKKQAYIKLHEHLKKISSKEYLDAEAEIQREYWRNRELNPSTAPKCAFD